MLIQKGFTRARERPCLTPCCSETRVSPKAGSHEHYPHGHDFDTQAHATTGARTVLRAKTVATRLSTEELEEVESAAKRSGKSLAEGLRDTALVEAQQSPADPVEVILAEVCATRYMLLNLFHATAQAASEGKQLLPETVLKIRETADAQKASKAHKLLQDSSASVRPEPKNGSKP